MSNSSIPKEKQTAYQRWEMSPLKGNDNLSEEPNDKNFPTSDQSTNSEELAKQEAVKIGLTEGYADGLRQANAEMLADKENILRLASTFSKSLGKAESEFSMEILRLSLDLAKAMVKTHLQLNSKAIMSVVKEISGHLPPDISQVRLKLHSEDAKTVKKLLLEDLTNNDWTILEDDEITRGGCIVETSVKQIDASIEKRWQRICDALGQDDDWIGSLR
jgi:flagellar assembly protein FliH